MIAEDSLRDDSSSASYRKLLVRADHFEEDLAALEAALASPLSAAASAAEEQKPTEFAELTFRGWGRFGRWPPPPTEEVQDHRISFGRFVDLLEQSMQPGHAAIRTFKAVEISFSSFYGCCREEDVERLFRGVLPNHPTMNRIQLGGNPVLARCVSLLASSVPSTRATPLLELTLDLYGSSGVADICNMLRRDVPLRALTLVSRLSPEDFPQIFQSLAANTNLEALAISFSQARPDAFCLKAPALRGIAHQGRIHGGRGGIVGPRAEHQHHPGRASRHGGRGLPWGPSSPGTCVGGAQHHTAKPLDRASWPGRSWLGRLHAHIHPHEHHPPEPAAEPSAPPPPPVPWGREWPVAAAAGDVERPPLARVQGPVTGGNQRSVRAPPPPSGSQHGRRWRAEEEDPDGLMSDGYRPQRRAMGL
jgi:hypothetical protein